MSRSLDRQALGAGRRRRRVLALLTGALLLPAARAQAAPAARLRWRLDGAAQRLEVGEVLMLSLEVWVSTWFQAPVEFPSTLAAEGALVELVGGSPDSRFEEQGGQRWTGLIRRYRLLPVQPGQIRVSLSEPLLVHPGGGKPMRLQPPAALNLQVSVPAGAQDIQPFVAARRLSLRQRWWPEAESETGLQVGELLRREIVLETDSSSPLLPAPEFGPAPGTRWHVLAPQRQEQRLHAAATAQLSLRYEAVYTLEQAGRVELPAVELVWWDVQARRRRVSRLEGRVLEVRPAQPSQDPFALPAAAPAEAAPERPGLGALWPSLGWPAAVLATASGAAWAWRRYSGGRDAGAASAQPSDPARRWRRLRRACRQHRAEAAEALLAAWLQGLPRDEAAHWHQDAALSQAVQQLQRLRFGQSQGSQAPWRGDDLWQALQGLHAAATQRAKLAQADLPALHP